jgi:hypothetical protein
MASGGGVDDKKEMKLYRIETLASGNKDILTDREDNLYIYEKGILYDTKDGFKKGTSHRMSKINLTILPYKEYANGGGVGYDSSDQKIKELTNKPSLDSGTGLIYYFDIPFTTEDIEEILASSKSILSAKFTPNKQFNIQPMVFIKDKVNGGEHTFSVAQIGILGAFHDKNKNKTASRKDFLIDYDSMAKGGGVGYNWSDPRIKELTDKLSRENKNDVVRVVLNYQIDKNKEETIDKLRELGAKYSRENDNETARNIAEIFTILQKN